MVLFFCLFFQFKIMMKKSGHKSASNGFSSVSCPHQSGMKFSADEKRVVIELQREFGTNGRG